MKKIVRKHLSYKFILHFTFAEVIQTGNYNFILHFT